MDLIKRWLPNVLLILISIIIGLVIFETVGGYVFKNPDPYKWYDRFMLFSAADGSSTFENVDDFFTYSKNTTIHSVTYYIVKGEWVKEYDYKFRTNSLGLNQPDEIKNDRIKILILGDSYTEGQGAKPWINILSESIKNPNLQIVNGGIPATGFQQWLKLHDYLRKSGIAFEKLVIIFISDDFRRGILNHNKKRLDCLKTPETCDGSEDLFGFDESKNVRIALNMFYNKRKNMIQLSFKRKISLLFPLSYTVLRNSKQIIINKLLFNRMEKQENNNKLSNVKAINHLIKLYNDKIIFIHIPAKDEILNGMSKLGTEARSAIRENGKEVIDGFEICRLKIEDYFPNDGHPNQQGYKKIGDCVLKVLNENRFLY
jgi:lysophospholipase L1-like esterase